VGGTFLGTLVGAGACVALYFAGLIPAADKGKTPPPPKTNNGGDPGKPAPMDFAAKLDHVKNGDLDKAAKAGIEKIDEKKPAELYGRALYNWRVFLSEQKGDPPFNPNDRVQKALKDLEPAIKAKNPDALFLRGRIRQWTGKVKEARADYDRGIKDFSDPVQKERFQAALDRLDLPPAKVEARAPRLPGAPRLRRAEMLVALLMLFQPPDKGKPKGAKGSPEAGFEFWRAVKLAREKKYDDALKALDVARARHGKRRFARLGKQQNPLSDPDEEIFLRACDELKSAWIIERRLRNPDYLTAEKEDRLATIDKLIEKAESTAITRARTALLKEVSKELSADKDKVFASTKELVDAVKKERKASADTIEGLETMVADKKKEVEGLEGKLKDAQTLAKENGEKLKVSEKRETALKATLAENNAAMKEIAEVLEVKFADPKKDREALLKAVKDTDRMARITDPKGYIRKIEKELAARRGALKDRWEPQEMLNFWLPLLQDQRDRKDLADKAVKDADRVLAARGTGAVLRGRAQVIRGLALRNEARYPQAKAMLEKARVNLADAGGPWPGALKEALREVSDPARFYARQAEALLNRGRSDEALTALNRGLKAVSDKRGPMLAMRGLILLERARSRGPVASGDRDVLAARKDASAAATEGTAEGHYAAGRIDEELGRWKQAADSYRAAIKANRAGAAIGARYRIALARVLLQSEAPAKPERGARRPARRGLRRYSGASWEGQRGLARRIKGARTALDLRTLDLKRLMLAVTLLRADDPGEDEPSAARKEAEKLADEVLKLGDKAPFDARAQALAVKGLYTRAIAEYAAGLRDNKLLAPTHANNLLALLARHPTLKRPESKVVPDPQDAEKHYSAGLNFYFARNYVNAEKEFLSAVENDNNDARFYYFLGLSRLAQGKRDAAEDFDAGARLERLGKPDRAAVSSALERVQGPMRRRLNAVRNRPVKDRGK
jgi:tetratricopeptide (TPR) repeat protein